ncbi:MAG: TraB/GumN family protein [Clostridiales bacterium]|nr:TraB/GumN family protein [Clostridiales bacterium]
MKKRIGIAAAAVVLIAVIACTVWITQREGSRGILYRVTGAEGSAYLLGSIHIGSSVMHPFGDTLTEAMADSEVFVFETDTSTDESLAQLAARQTLPEGASLQTILGNTLFDDITAAYKALGLNTAKLDSRQPWAVINTLAVYSSAAEMGVSDVNKAISLGVETAVREYANSHHKRFAYLETVDEIADTMESFSGDLNRCLLQDEADVILGRKSTFETDTIAQWPQWWRDGDAEAFRDFYRFSFLSADTALYEEYEDKLITQRNAMMALRLDEMLQGDGTYFVTVGLLHLIGEDGGIPALLREMGFTVEQMAQE